MDLIFAFIFLMIGNFYFSGSLIFGTIFAFLQFILVILYIYKGQLRFAFLLHVSFIITSLNFTILSDFFSIVSTPYNYSKIKLFAQLPISFIFTLFFSLISFNKRSKALPFFYRFISQYRILFFVASIIGIIGLIFLSYSFSYFLDYFFYSISVLLFLETFQNFSNEQFYFDVKKTIRYALIASPISSLIFFFLGNTATYGGIEIIPVNSLFLFTPYLVFSNDNQNLTFKIIGILSFFFVSIFSIGGKGVAFLVILVIYKLYFIVKKLKYGFILVVVILFFSAIILNAVVIENGNNFLFFSKVSQFFSIFNFEDFDEISDSPRVRVAEVMNIIYQYVDNPFLSIFGNGFGGFFEDKLGLFAFMDLSQGSFDEAQISQGRFFRPHDTLPVILLIHGLSGLFFLIYWVFFFLRKSLKSYHLLGVLPWLFLTYGFDLNIAIFGILFLYTGLYELNINLN